MINYIFKESLHSVLTKTLMQLKNRKMMIPRYCDQSHNWNGPNHYSMDMIPKIEKQIEETEAAIRGIEEWRKSKRASQKKIKIKL